MHTIFRVKIELGYLNVCSTAFLSCSLQVSPLVGGGLWFFVMDTLLAVHQLLFSKHEGGISKVDHMATNTVPPVQNTCTHKSFQDFYRSIYTNNNSALLYIAIFLIAGCNSVT